MKNILKRVINGLVFVLVIDLLGFIAWKTSGQVAPDNFHAGVITESIINLIK